MAETHELGGSTIVVDRATPKASNSIAFPLLMSKFSSQRRNSYCFKVIIEFYLN